MLKVAILDDNEMYLQRLHEYWSRTYGSSALMIFAFSDSALLARQLEVEKFDIVLVNSTMEMDWEAVGQKTLKLYLLAGRKDGEVDGIPALAKNGSADELYAKMLACYEKHKNAERGALPGKVVLFTSAQGGCGTSSCAVGYGKYLAARGKKVLYLNLEPVSAQETMLDGDGGKSLEDLFYWCGTDRRKADESLRELLSRDGSGLQYVASCRNPLELREKTGGEIRGLLTAVTQKGNFDVIVADRGFSMDEVTDTLIHMAEEIVLVAGMDAIGRQKYEKTMVLLEEMNRRGFGFTVKTRILYNRTDGDWQGGEALGSMPEWKGLGPAEVTERMSGFAEFGKLLPE